MSSDVVKEFTDDNFAAEVLKSDSPVLVDFWAPWCGPCRRIAPMIDELAGENPTIKVGKLNIDENTKVAQEYGITSIPTLLMFKDGEISDSFLGGSITKGSLQQAFDAAAA